MSSAFDPQTYLDAATTEAGERRAPFAVHNLDAADGGYLATIGEIEAKTWESKNPEAKKKSGIRYVVPLKLQIGPQTREATKFSGTEFTLTDSVMVDLTESGMIDWNPGQNRVLTAYREATDLNKKGENFSARMLQGRMVKVMLEHEVYQNWPQERVKSVLKPS